MVLLLDWIRKWGWFGTVLAKTIELACAYYGVTIAAAMTLIFSLFESSVEWVQQPEVWVPAVIFIFLLWTIIGIVTLKKMNEPKTVRMAHDYAYSFICDGGFNALLVRFPMNDPNHPNEDGIAIGCNLRNVGAGPAKIKVEDFRVVLDSRTSADDKQIEQVFSKLALKIVQSGSIVRDKSKNRLSGTASLKMIYGPPEGPYQRRYTMRAKIEVFIKSAPTDDDPHIIQILNSDVNEHDECV